MKAKTYKRFLAYLIDITILILILITLDYFLPKDNINQELNLSLSQLEEQLLKKEITYNEYVTEFSKINYLIDKNNVIYSALNILLVCIYFVIIPVITKGKTLGLHILKIKIKGNLNINSLLLRNIFTNGILYMILNLILVYILKDKSYFIGITILGFIQILLVLISSFMIIYRKDKRGLQDIFSKTSIIEEV